MFLLKMVGVTGIKQDEFILRQAAKMEAEAHDSMQALRARMAKNTVYCKQAFAETAKISKAIADNLEKVADSVSNSQEGQRNFAELRRNQAAQEQLAMHKEQWRKATLEFLDAADGDDPDLDSDNPDSMKLAEMLAQYMAQGEPNMQDQACAVILYHPHAPLSESLKVAFAVGDVGFTTGQTLRRSAKNKSQTVESVWQVLEQGNAVLSNPHNHPEEATNAVSICPLLSMNRHRFGVVVSGAPALPDEYFECFCRTAGQMFERIGKLEIIWRIMENVQQFIEKTCLASHQLVYCKWVNDAAASPPVDDWTWQPFLYTHPTNDKRFELPLQWSSGERIGLFTVECGTFTNLDEQLLVLLHTIAPVVLEAVEEVERLELGQKPPLYTINTVMAKYDAMVKNIGQNLSREVEHSVRSRNLNGSEPFYASLVETAAYCAKSDDKDLLRLMQAVCALAGFPPAKTWGEIRKQLKNARALCDALADISKFTDAVEPQEEAGGGAKKAKKKKKKKQAMDRFNISEAYLKSVDLLEMDRQAPVPIKILLRYLRATKLVYNIGMCMSLFTAKDGAVNPIAQKIFQAIDKDNDKVLTTDEVIAYFVTEYGPDPSLKLLKVLDSDADGKITMEEWHKGWQNGDFDLEKIDDGGGEEAKNYRILSRHLTRDNILAPIAKKADKGGGKKSRVATPAPASAPASAKPKKGGSVKTVQIAPNPTKK